MGDGVLSEPCWLWPIPCWCLFTTYWRDGTVYREIGGNYFDEGDPQATLRRSVRRIDRLGFKVRLETALAQARVFSWQRE